MPKLTELLPVGAPALVALMSLPLAFKLIGPNSVYGYRTSASLSSPEQWYRANSYAGWLGFAFSLLAMIINLYLLRSNLVSPEHKVLISTLVFAGLMLVCGVIQYAANG